MAVLAQAGFDIPTFFSINTNVGGNARDPETLKREVNKVMAFLGMSERSVAVRSSSVEEDGASASFAGQFESFLDVSPGDIVEYALKVPIGQQPGTTHRPGRLRSWCRR